MAVSGHADVAAWLALSIRAAPDFRGGADVRVRSRVDVRERWRGDRSEARLPDGYRSVWDGAEHIGTCRIRRTTRTLRRQLYRHRVQ